MTGTIIRGFAAVLTLGILLSGLGVPINEAHLNTAPLIADEEPDGNGAWAG